MLAAGLGACSQELDHYETRTSTFCDIFCIKNVQKYLFLYIKKRCTRGVLVFLSQSKNVIKYSNSACMTKSSFVTEKKCVKCT